MPDDLLGRFSDLGLPDGEDGPENRESFGETHGEPTPVEGIIPLGYDREAYYYLSRARKQIISIAAKEHSKSGLMNLASLAHYWQRSRFVNPKGAINWDEAADWLMTSCRAVGLFDPDRLRGRGAWIDEGRTVLHLGDRLVVDGDETVVGVVPGSRFIYEIGISMGGIDTTSPLSSTEASRLMDLCIAAPFVDPESQGRLLAGWLVIASVCGAMPWRPHLWLSGEHGSGKTWCIDNIIRPIVGLIAIRVASKTTEAGVRGIIGVDARPVLFDEAEGQNEQDRSRIQQVLDLARQASSEDGADIVKGTQTGGVRRYRIRSCFMFSSINLGLTQAADESRTVVLTTQLASDPAVRLAAFMALKKLHAETITPEFGERLLARTLRLLPIIRHNAEVFAQAIARSGKSRRAGDTIGVLLAGAWSLRSNREATPEEVDAFLAGTPWVQSALNASTTEPEWTRASSYLMQHRLRVTPSNGRPEDIPIGELISGQMHSSGDYSVSLADGATALARAGIKIIGDGFTVTHVALANTSQTIASIFGPTPWGGSWLATLSRIPKAEKPNKSIRFGSLVSKAVLVPIDALLGNIEA